METLQELFAQMDRQRKLRTMEESQTRQLRDLEEKVRALDAVRAREQEDVDRLNRTSLSALFYSMVGKMDEKLDKERREAYAAAAKYEAARRELEALRAERERVRAELDQLRGCEARCAQAMRNRAADLKAHDSVRGPQVAALEEQLAHLQDQLRELREAIDAGNRALSTARGVQKSLHSAENWGVWDMLGGGGILTQVAKHGHLDDAQDQVEQLQRQLRSFKTELADVEIQADIQVQVDDFLRFADWFFDGLFVDWTVQERIHDAQDQVDGTVQKIQETLRRLETMGAALDSKGQALQSELDSLVLSAPLGLDAP